MNEQTRRDFLKAAGLGTVSLAMQSCTSTIQQLAKRVKKPNVILIMTDDQGFGDIRSNGNGIIDTPVLDRLGSEGVRFDRFFVSPVCAPTRASLLTGRYHLRTGTHGVTRGRENMRMDEVTIAQVLKQAGYVTGCFGKWHNGAHYPYHPNGRGFDEFFGFCAGHWNNYFDTTLEHNGKLVKTSGYITDVLTDSAVRFIEENKKKSFFCYVPYNAPHSPFQVPDKYFDKYKQRDLDDKTSCIYGMCENIDENIGRILKCLGDLNLNDNTIVLFFTDNGPNSKRFNDGMKGRKGSTNEGGVRVPLFIRWPGHIKAGSNISRIAADIDIFATIVELCGVLMPQTKPLDGVSLVPLLKGQKQTWPDRMIFTFRNPRGLTADVPGAVRTQRWRAVKKNEQWKLYDMLSDPEQNRDVSVQFPNVREKLSFAYEAIVKDVCKDGFEPLPIPVGYPQWNIVELPAHEAFLQPAVGKGISYKGRAGWAHDWITNWMSTEAYPLWHIEVVNPGRFEITLMYTCSSENIGTKLRVEIGSASLDAMVRKVHNPDTIVRPHRSPDVAVKEKKWAPLSCGTVQLAKGRAKLIVRALEITGKQALDIKAIRLRRMD